MNSSNKLRKGIVALIAAVLFLGLFSILAETATDKTCTANGKSGTCLLTVECANNGGTSYPHSATVTGCKDYKKDIQCCIPKEDDGSVTIDASPATVAFKSEPITLVSDRVFLETYSKTSKIIDASKITYKGEPIFENAACVLNNDNPNIGGRVEVTVKVFNNIDEQIDTMTFVMKAGGDLWDYAECGADGKGVCTTGDDPFAKGREKTAGTNDDFLKQCQLAYKNFEDIAANKRIACYVEKGGSGTTTEIKTDENCEQENIFPKDEDDKMCVLNPPSDKLIITDTSYSNSQAGTKIDMSSDSTIKFTRIDKDKSVFPSISHNAIVVYNVDVTYNGKKYIFEAWVREAIHSIAFQDYKYVFPGTIKLSNGPGWFNPDSASGYVASTKFKSADSKRSVQLLLILKDDSKLSDKQKKEVLNFVADKLKMKSGDLITFT